MSRLDIEVAGHMMSVEDAQAWWGNNLPTEQRGDGVVLITKESLFQSLSERLDMTVEEIEETGATSVFFDVIDLIQTMLAKEESGQLAWVSPSYGNGQPELSPGYKLVKNAER